MRPNQVHHRHGGWIKCKVFHVTRSNGGYLCNKNLIYSFNKLLTKVKYAGRRKAVLILRKSPNVFTEPVLLGLAELENG